MYFYNIGDFQVVGASPEILVRQEHTPEGDKVIDPAARRHPPARRHARARTRPSRLELNWPIRRSAPST